ncbi:hypothetical protein SAMN04490357_4868 [Streptomyces misionensis]|uniref:Lipoprotein n=2 Tax=Streptomyces TaxID=1883 RepID=A0A1H5AV27_9ACTN|nr:hypothetical protein SAMN04490357_4868 [Streptomyces misionensis]SFY50924.1 hypothetical protein STEPF1_04180 [Streptomyces sp. F-1]
MKNRTSAAALLASTVLITLTGCSMTSSTEPDDVPSAGTSTSRDAADRTESVSSRLYDLIGVKGKASDSGPGVQECSGKDRDTYFRIFHKWSFYPASASDLDAAMQHLKDGMPEHGWKIVEYGPDTSRNKNLTLVADNDEQKAGVHITQMKKRNPPKLSLMVVSGCYRVPEGQKVEHF